MTMPADDIPPPNLAPARVRFPDELKVTLTVALTLVTLVGIMWTDPFLLALVFIALAFTGGEVRS